MPKAFTEWNVLPHEAIQKPAENLWWVRGSLPGMSLKRVMTVVRLSDGKLLLHNAIALKPSAQEELEGFGSPAVLVVPSGVHRLDAPAYKARYPGLAVYTPKNARGKVEEVVPVDGVYTDYPGDAHASLEPLQGVADAEGVLRVRSAGGVTLVLNDCVFNMDRKRDVLGYLFTTALGSAPGPRVSRLTKLFLIKDKPAFRAELLRLAETPDLTRVIVAHEKVSEGTEARATLLRAAEYV